VASASHQFSMQNKNFAA